MYISAINLKKIKTGRNVNNVSTSMQETITKYLNALNFSPQVKAQLSEFLLNISFIHSSASYWASTMCQVWAGHWRYKNEGEIKSLLFSGGGRVLLTTRVNTECSGRTDKSPLGVLQEQDEFPG